MMIDVKSDMNIRVMSFNVNGLKTIFNYHPWNTFNNNLDSVFTKLQADIISLQELKLSGISNFNFNLKKYKCFVTLPKTKKGYSGVGLFVRIPETSETPIVKQNLMVIKAEEGLTGFLKINGTKIRDLNDDAKQIGQYPDIEESLGLQIDSEGRCVIVELANNLVVFSLYCPANSNGTEEGEAFKIKFMEILINRCEALHAQGKEIMIIGDINISLDLIDQAEGINVRLKQKLIEYSDDGKTFELKNLNQCFNFKFENKARTHLNKYVIPTIGNYKQVMFPTQFLYDTTRLIQGRKMSIYTVWNTLNNSRQTNYGSRIDLILTTKIWSELASQSSICASILGSDHCPVFTDFHLKEVQIEVEPPKTLDFEVKKFYKLVKHQDISTMFKAVKRKPKEVFEDSLPVVYKSRRKKDQPSIGNFFNSRKLIESQLEIEASLYSSQASDNNSSNDSLEGTQVSITELQSSSESQTKESIDLKDKMKSIYGSPPMCQHDLPCQLKTSLNTKSRGKKFWCCPKTETGFQGKCDYFKWLNPK